MEATILRWMYDRPLDTLLVTFGVGLILQQLARDIFGAPAKEVSTPTWLSGTVPILGYGFPVTRLFIIALSALCGVRTSGPALSGGCRGDDEKDACPVSQRTHTALHRIHARRYTF